MKKERDWLTTKEVAQELGWAVPTLSRWRVEGRGPKFFKVGTGKNSIRYPVSEIAAYRAQFPNLHSSTAQTKNNKGL